MCFKSLFFRNEGLSLPSSPIPYHSRSSEEAETIYLLIWTGKIQHKEFELLTVPDDALLKGKHNPPQIPWGSKKVYKQGTNVRNYISPKTGMQTMLEKVWLGPLDCSEFAWLPKRLGSCKQSFKVQVAGGGHWEAVERDVIEIR